MNFFNCKHNKKSYEFTDEELVESYRKSKKFIVKVVEKLLSFN